MDTTVGIIPLAMGCCNKINGITFDGCSYFCTMSCKCETAKLSSCYKIEKIYDTCREYCCICYDWCEKCFWASVKRGGILYKLDKNMNEIDCLVIKSASSLGQVTGIAYDCCGDKLVLSFAKTVAEVDKATGQSSELFCLAGSWITGIVKICGFYIATVLRGHKYRFEVFDEELQKADCCNFCGQGIPINIIFNPCKIFSPSRIAEVYVLKNFQYPHIYEYRLCRDWICEKCRVCCDFCGTSCEERRMHCGIVESIAFIETAIAHILNAEGEKIQKVLEETGDIDCILRVNDSVNNTIVNITHLEQVLYNKLSVAINSDNGCCI